MKVRIWNANVDVVLDNELPEPETFEERLTQQEALIQRFVKENPSEARNVIKLEWDYKEENNAS